MSLVHCLWARLSRQLTITTPRTGWFGRLAIATFTTGTGSGWRSARQPVLLRLAPPAVRPARFIGAEQAATRWPRPTLAATTRKSTFSSTDRGSHAATYPPPARPSPCTTTSPITSGHTASSKTLREHCASRTLTTTPTAAWKRTHRGRQEDGDLRKRAVSISLK